MQIKRTDHARIFLPRGSIQNPHSLLTQRILLSDGRVMHHTARQRDDFVEPAEGDVAGISDGRVGGGDGASEGEDGG